MSTPQNDKWMRQVSDLKILTLNVRGLNDKKKRQNVYYWLRRTDADIIALQENHLGRACDEVKWSQEWDGQSYWTVAAGNSKGVALLFSNRRHQFDITNVLKGQSGRLISLSTKVDDKIIRIACIYSPNNAKKRVQFFKSEIDNHMVEEQYNIVRGDFNCTLNENDRCGENVGRKEVGRDELVTFMKRYQLHDVYSRRNLNSVQFTYFKPNSSVKSRIDFVLANEIMDMWIQEVEILPAVFADHNAVYVKMKMTEETKGLNCFNRHLRDFGLNGLSAKVIMKTN